MLISRRKDPVVRFAFVMDMLKDAQDISPVKHHRTRKWNPQVGDQVRIKPFAARDFSDIFNPDSTYIISQVRPDSIALKEIEKAEPPFFPLYFFNPTYSIQATAMASDGMKSAILKQISMEFKSASLYYSMEEYFKSENLDGFAEYMKKMADEEIGHASDFFDIVFPDVEEKQQTPEIEKTEQIWESALDVFNDILSNERAVTESINGLMGIAKDDGDVQTIHFLNNMIDSQVKDIAELEHIIDTLKRFGGNIDELMEFDKEIRSSYA